MVVLCHLQGLKACCILVCSAGCIRASWGCGLFRLLGVALWALLVVSMTVALLGRLFFIYSYSGLACMHVTLLLRGTLLTALHCVDRDRGEALATGAAVVMGWIATRWCLVCCRVFFWAIVLPAFDVTFSAREVLEGDLCTPDNGASATKCGRFARECAFSQPCFWQRGVSFSMCWWSVLPLTCAVSLGTAQSVSLTLQGFSGTL